MCSYAFATANLAFSLLWLPFCLRVNLRCKHLNRAEDLPRYFGFSKTEPFDKVAKMGESFEELKNLLIKKLG